MSTTNLPLQTAQQPSFDFAHITAHPGSTLAGVGLIATAASQAFALGTPATPVGWMMFGMQFLGGIMAMLGK